MLRKLAGFVLGVAKWSLLLVGALVVALVWWLSSGDNGKQKPKDDSQVTTIERQAERVGCLCADGSLCAGPRGGRYCIKPDGGKKYQP